MLLELTRELPPRCDPETVREMIVEDPRRHKYQKRVLAWSTLFGEKTVREIVDLLIAVKRCKCRRAFYKRIFRLYMEVYEGKKRQVPKDRAPHRSYQLQHCTAQNRL